MVNGPFPVIISAVHEDKRILSKAHIYMTLTCNVNSSLLCSTARYTLWARRYSWSQMSISASPWADKERSCWMQWEKQLHWPHFVIVWNCHRNTLAKNRLRTYCIWAHSTLSVIFLSKCKKKRKKRVQNKRLYAKPYAHSLWCCEHTVCTHALVCLCCRRSTLRCRWEVQMRRCISDIFRRGRYSTFDSLVTQPFISRQCKLMFMLIDINYRLAEFQLQGDDSRPQQLDTSQHWPVLPNCKGLKIFIERDIQMYIF